MKSVHSFLLCMYTTIVITFPIIRCRQMNYCRRVRSVASDDAITDVDDVVFNTETNRDNHGIVNTEGEEKEEVHMNTAYPPEGAGLFRDPMDVLGPKFSPLITINLCEVKLHQQANEVTDIKFTSCGNKTCVDICVQYRANMRLNGPVSVTLVENYCDYTGAMIFDEESDLSTTCTCMYKMRCNQRSKVVMYIFEVNCKGFIKVSITELMKEKCIT